MHHAHPLAIIPLQSDSSSRSTSRSGSPDHVTMRALIPRQPDSEACSTPLRSEDDNALMRSLISVLPHEQADSQFSVTSPVARSESELPRSEPWLGVRPSSSNGGDGGSCSGSNVASFCGGGVGDPTQSTPFATSRGLADSGLDFLGTTDSVRDLLHLPYTSDAVTVGLHRVGQTLVLDGNLGEVLVSVKSPAPPAPAEPASGSPSDHERDRNRRDGSSSRNSRKNRVDKVGAEQDGRWVMVGRGGKPQRGDEWEHADAEGGVTVSGDQDSRGVGGTRGWVNGGSSGQGTGTGTTEEEWSLYQGDWPRLGSSSSDVQAAGALSIIPTRPRGGSFGSRPPEPAGFWRAVQWEVAGMRLMLGSSLQICSTSEHPQVSVRLHDGDEELSLCTCLDYYLDNVMENVPELALCMREKGYIQGCRLVSTEDIPYLGSCSRKKGNRKAGTPSAAADANTDEVGGPVPLFDPVMVELNATILLRFLQENCSREGGTYLLHRSEGAAHVQLYDVSALSRQRSRRWKWLLAMLCYRFALRISHHIRQPWCRGRSAAGVQQVPGAHGGPGPHVVRQLQRRQRQLLENSLELLEELAQLGGGGHETICASVQEHIADTYLSDGADGLGPGNSDVDSRSRQALRDPESGKAAVTASGSKVIGQVGSTQDAPWRIDPDGGVWTSPRTVPTTAASGVQGQRRRAKRRGGKGGLSGHPRANDDIIAEPSTSSTSMRLSATSQGSRSEKGGDVTRSGEEVLDKAQDHLASGIAILRSVMVRQESAAAGRNDSTADVVIVGESRLPVAVMKQSSPWLAIDDEEDNENVDARGQGSGKHTADGGRASRASGARRGSFDESEDPATAMAVVSEQLWGLQLKLVGTYMAVARARLRRGFPSLILSPSSVEDEYRGASAGKQAGGEAAAGINDGDTEGGPDKKTYIALAAGAIEALTSAWEHLTDAVVTLDRRAASALACEEISKGQNSGDGLETGESSSSSSVNVDRDAGIVCGEPRSPELQSCERSQDDRAQGLGALWAGSLSEALAKSGGGTEVDGMGMDIMMHGPMGGVGHRQANDVSVEGQADSRGSSVAWDSAARVQLGARRAELFELCGDVAHVCFRLCTSETAPPLSSAADPLGKELLGDLLPQLEAMLSSTRPSIILADMDVCCDLHGHVMETLLRKVGDRGRGSNGSSAGGGGCDTKRGGSSGDYVPPGTTSQENAGKTFDFETGTGPDPKCIADLCLHAVARQGHVPGDTLAWSLCRLAGACYEQALVDLPDSWHAYLGSGSGRYLAQYWSVDGLKSPGGARARLMRKMGDASNELGKLMAQCAGALVQAPAKPTPQISSAATGSAAHLSDPSGSTDITQSAPPHPGLTCAISVACAEACFRHGLEAFTSIDDARNIALLLCNLASVERLKPRALARLREAGSSAVPDAWTEAMDVSEAANGFKGRSRRPLGAQAAIELCGRAHVVLGRRDADPRTWDHASAELAMAYLCLGVERRQELLTILGLQDGTRSRGRMTSGGTAGTVVSAPTGAQNRGVVEPLERALQVYTELKNASQAAACHYQVGQYYAKVFLAYLPPSNPEGHQGSGGGRVGHGRSDARSSAFSSLKAWDVGQRAVRHLLAARAYFGPFEHGPTSVILALDLCDLYVSLANLGMGIPKVTERTGSSGGEGSARGEQTAARVRPASVVRCKCLEGAIRALLETQSVFAAAGVDTIEGDGIQVGNPNPGNALGARLRRLLGGVMERVPRVMKALVRASLEVESSSQAEVDALSTVGGSTSGRGRAGGSPGSSTTGDGGRRRRPDLVQPVDRGVNEKQMRSAVFKAMYRKCLVQVGTGGRGAQALLVEIATDYATVSKRFDDGDPDILGAG